MLSDLKNETFTLINQIPQSPEVATKSKWIKHTLQRCGKAGGILDKSNGTMVYKANTFTAYIFDWDRYKEPNWLEDGYYAMSDTEKSGFYTANIGDLIIFADIDDIAPTTTAEFTALTQKYRDMGGLISGVNVHIKHKPDGSPWRTNHIELIKG